MFLAEKRLLALETAVKQVENDNRAMRATLDSERVELANLKEQAIRAINRLRQREVRAEPNGDPKETPKPMNPLAQELLKGTHHELLPR